MVSVTDNEDDSMDDGQKSINVLYTLETPIARSFWNRLSLLPLLPTHSPVHCIVVGSAISASVSVAASTFTGLIITIIHWTTTAGQHRQQ